jgi:hypothetical protein
MAAGRRVIYADFLGYDEVAHHAGPLNPDAIACLRPIDTQLRIIEEAGRKLPRQYEIVVVSDHGQSWGATFLQRYGLTLEALVRQLAGTDSVYQPREKGEGSGYISAAVAQIKGSTGLGAAAADRIISAAVDDETDDAGGSAEKDQRAAATAEIVVCGSGNLGLISFTRHPGRLTVEAVEGLHPGLMDGLVQHPGVGWILMLSEARGPIVMGKTGVRRLCPDEVTGEDPLAGFAPATPRFLLRLAEYPNVPDIIVNSTLFDAEKGEIAAFEELIGAHGGAGGWQTRPFVAFPAHWTAETPDLEGSEKVHQFLSSHIYGDGRES